MVRSLTIGILFAWPALAVAQDCPPSGPPYFEFQVTRPSATNCRKTRLAVFLYDNDGIRFFFDDHGLLFNDNALSLDYHGIAFHDFRFTFYNSRLRHGFTLLWHSVARATSRRVFEGDPARAGLIRAPVASEPRPRRATATAVGLGQAQDR